MTASSAHGDTETRARLGSFFSTCQRVWTGDLTHSQYNIKDNNAALIVWLGGPATEKFIGKKLDYDGKTGQVTNCPDANQYLSRKYRDGWALNG